MEAMAAQPVRALHKISRGTREAVASAPPKWHRVPQSAFDRSKGTHSEVFVGDLARSCLCFFGTAAAAASTTARRRGGTRPDFSSMRARQTELQQGQLQEDDVMMERDFNAAALERNFSTDAPKSSSSAFEHPPRSERSARTLPFSGGLEVFPLALFPWSPEYGGRPWDAWTETHKKRLVFVASVHLGALAAPFYFSWGAFTTFIIFSVMCTTGITLSYHRQLSHRAFECPKWLEYLFAYFGCLAVQGAPIGWVQMHRHHHKHSDKEGDLHSPLDGFWWSHMGFMFDASTPEKLVGQDAPKDLASQDFYRFMDDATNYTMSSVVLPIALLAALGGLPYVLWGFCLRTVYIWHMTWAVNSVGHVWGYQTYDSGDNSRNNWVFGILGFGDGWHNNHHAFPRSCRHGIEWWELDVNWMLLQLLSACGLAWNLQLPSEKRKQQLALS